MSELGYRDAQVNVSQGVSLNGDDLIITFVIDEGLPTVVHDVSITGNKAVRTDELLAELPAIVGKNYSRARERNAVRKLSRILLKPRLLRRPRDVEDDRNNNRRRQKKCGHRIHS